MRLTDDQIKMARITYTKVVQDDFILDLIDTIEALQQENEQLQAQAARVREALRKAREEVQNALDNYELVGEHEYDISEHLQIALTAIDKVIGGKEDV